MSNIAQIKTVSDMLLKVFIHICPGNYRLRFEILNILSRAAFGSYNSGNICFEIADVNKDQSSQVAIAMKLARIIPADSIDTKGERVISRFSGKRYRITRKRLFISGFYEDTVIESRDYDIFPCR